MTTIAAVTAAPLLLRNNQEHLSDLLNWLKTWIGWGVHRKLGWALSGLPSLYLLSDLDDQLQVLQKKFITKSCKRYLVKLIDHQDSSDASVSAVNTPAVVSWSSQRDLVLKSTLNLLFVGF